MKKNFLLFYFLTLRSLSPAHLQKHAYTMSAIAKFVKSQTKILFEHNAEIATKLTEALGLTDEQVATMNDTLKTGVDEMVDLKKPRKGGSKKGTTRAPTAYNIFVKDKIAELKASDPTIDRKQLMIQAAAAWTLKKKATADADATSPKKKLKK